MMDNEHLRDTSARNGKLYKLVFVSFGLLCILQAAVNISLRLTLYSSNSRTEDFEALIKTVTEEGDTLKKKLDIFDHYARQGWIYFNHSFYYISSTKKPWHQSREDCLQRGADLVIINSKEEQDFTRQFNKLLWIGLSDTETEGIWKWVDGTVVSTSYWHLREPNNYGGTDEDCAEIRRYEMTDSWNDTPCTSQNSWICEKVMAL